MVTAGKSAAGEHEAVRRLIDLGAAGLGLLILTPVFAAVTLAIKLHDGGPVLYCATRVGQGGKPFRLYKFRTMCANADRLGPGITGGDDPRVTPVGRWLRRSKLDELPQLLNVLRGEMSLVGPRPEDPRYVALYTPAQRAVLAARPGITGAASLAYKEEARLLTGPDWEQIYRSQIMPAKLALELEYLARRTIRSDLELIFSTLGALVLRPREGAQP